MLHKTKGIIFRTHKFRETSVITRIYTEHFGVQSYIVNSVRTKKAKVSASILQPGILVEMVVYHKPNGKLQRIYEINSNPVYKKIPFDLIKSSIVLFLTEVLCNSIKEEESNSDLFEFIFNSFLKLDVIYEKPENFHLIFMIQLSKYLGFYPQLKNMESAHIFDLMEGTFVTKEPEHPHYISQNLCKYFSEILLSNQNNLNTVQIPKTARHALIEKMLEYYQLHIANFKAIKSYPVLKEIFNIN